MQPCISCGASGESNQWTVDSGRLPRYAWLCGCACFRSLGLASRSLARLWLSHARHWHTSNPEVNHGNCHRSHKKQINKKQEAQRPTADFESVPATTEATGHKRDNTMDWGFGYWNPWIGRAEKSSKVSRQAKRFGHRAYPKTQLDTIGFI